MRGWGYIDYETWYHFHEILRPVIETLSPSFLTFIHFLKMIYWAFATSPACSKWWRFSSEQNSHCSHVAQSGKDMENKKIHNLSGGEKCHEGKSDELKEGMELQTGRVYPSNKTDLTEGGRGGISSVMQIWGYRLFQAILSHCENLMMWQAELLEATPPTSSFPTLSSKYLFCFDWHWDPLSMFTEHTKVNLTKDQQNFTLNSTFWPMTSYICQILSDKSPNFTFQKNLFIIKRKISL